MDTNTNNKTPGNSATGGRGAFTASTVRRIAIAVGLVAIITLVWVFRNQSRLAGAGSGSPTASAYGVVPDFSLTERSGRTFRKKDLDGSVWIASFIFTRCTTICPRSVSELAVIETKLPPEVRLVSFSVDPEYDTPEVLSEYADLHGIDSPRWFFLTGEKKATLRLIRDGFRIVAETNENGSPGSEVVHSPRFALVDSEGRIQGYYDSTDSIDMNRLTKEALRLVRMKRERT